MWRAKLTQSRQAILWAVLFLLVGLSTGVVIVELLGDVPELKQREEGWGPGF
jgi:hypothetical protein